MPGTMRGKDFVNKWSQWRRKLNVHNFCFIRFNAVNACCHKSNKSFSCKSGNTSNLSKYSAKVHHIKVDKCSFRLFQPTGGVGVKMVDGWKTSDFILRAFGTPLQRHPILSD